MRICTGKKAKQFAKQLKFCSFSQRRENSNEKKIALATFSTRFRFLSRNPKIVSSEKKIGSNNGRDFFFRTSYFSEWRKKWNKYLFEVWSSLSLSFSLSLSLSHSLSLSLSICTSLSLSLQLSRQPSLSVWKRENACLWVCVWVSACACCVGRREISIESKQLRWWMLSNPV